MPTRKTFITAGVFAAATVSTLRSGQVLAAVPTPAPSPTPTPAPAPSKLAEELAKSLQRGLPKANLSDSTTSKIAADIQGNFAISNSFRGRKNETLPPPDFVFAAAAEDRP